MEEYRQITLDEWTQWKEDIRKKLAETANNFVHIGYRLKQIRDSRIFGGAEDIFEFAQNEYGLGKSTVSRFIAINEKYSEGGNSLELREEFRNFSSSKLSEMLTLPDKEVELINERTTIRAIRELKKFDAEDPDKIQEAEEAQERDWTPLEKCVIDYFHRNGKEILDKVMELLEQETPDYKQAAEIMAPSGQAFHKKGIVFLFMYEWGDGIKYKLMTSPEPVCMTWEDFLDTIYGIFGSCTPGKVWEEFYGQQDEEKEQKTQENKGFEAVATSQQDEEKTEEKGSGPEPETADQNEQEPEQKLETGQQSAKEPEPETEQQSVEEPGQEPESAAKHTSYEEQDEEKLAEEIDELIKDETQEKSETELEGQEEAEKDFKEEMISELIQEIRWKAGVIQRTTSSAERDIVEWIEIQANLSSTLERVKKLVEYLHFKQEDEEVEE